MKVLMLGWELPPHNSGGLGVACLGLAQALTRKGVNITFVLPRKINIQDPGFEVYFLDTDFEFENLKSAYTGLTGGVLKILMDDFPPDFVRGAMKFAEKIEKIAKLKNADVVHAHDWMTFPAGIVAQKKTKTPLIAHVHSTEIDRTGGNFPNPYVYAIEKEGLQLANKIIAVSNFTKNMIVDNYQIPPQKVAVVYNGIEKTSSQKLSPALAELKKMGYKIVLFLGRVTLQKGPEYFIKAAKRALEFNKKIIFVVVGDGDMMHFMIYEASRLGIADKMIFTGFLRGEEKDRIYQTADLYVMPSVSEPFGITTLEAIANNTPVLISKQSGVSEVLQNVLKVDFWDTEEMANKILSLVKYKSLGKVLRAESKKELVNINWHKSADECIKVYRSLV
ncbi:MAG: glycosyltransferase family 4 protein [Patescibacteria group bacterium]|nr:glycosyltransferase family 4 protein [Patescibacteria group bacterium]